MKKLIRINIVTTLVLAGLFIGINKLFATPWGECPEADPGFTVFLAHNFDCAKYYKCMEGKAIIQSCAPGMHFNPRLSVCDRAEDAGCGVGKGEPDDHLTWGPEEGNVSVGVWVRDCIGTEGYCVPSN